MNLITILYINNSSSSVVDKLLIYNDIRTTFIHIYIDSVVVHYSCNAVKF